MGLAALRAENTNGGRDDVFNHDSPLHSPLPSAQSQRLGDLLCLYDVIIHIYLYQLLDYYVDQSVMAVKSRWLLRSQTQMRL